MAGERTAITILIDDHYQRTGAAAGWKNARLLKLCRAFACTPFELGKLCGVDFEMMRKMLSNDHHPLHVSLHYARYEAYNLSRTGKPVPPLLEPIHLFGPPTTTNSHD